LSHVALVIPSLDRIGGAERQVLALATGLVGRGWRVSVVTLAGSGGDAAADLQAAGASFLSLEMRKGLADPRGWIRFHRWLNRARPDIVHAHLPHAAWLSRWSRLGAPTRVLVDTFHSSSTGTLGRRLGYRWSNWLPDQVTAVSQAVASSHLARRMTSRNKFCILPNGVDEAFFRPDPEARQALRSELGLSGGFLWLAVGRLEPVKDYPTLLRAFAEIRGNARLAIAGAGPQRAALNQMASQLGIAHRILFLGFQADVRRVMQAADAFVLTSRWEGLPMALLEAAACALPTVATNVPGTREAVIDGSTGLLVEAAAPDSLERAMVSLMRFSTEQRQAMGQRARQRIIEHFSLSAALDRWEALYPNLLAANHTPRRWANSR